MYVHLLTLILWYSRQKSEDNLGAAENDLERHANTITQLTLKNEDLQTLADSAARLKDQVDEYVSPPSCFALKANFACRYKHAAERLQKNENVMEKYKKKLQEGADLRQTVKVGGCHSVERISYDSAIGSRKAKRRPRRQERRPRGRISQSFCLQASDGVI